MQQKTLLKQALIISLIGILLLLFLSNILTPKLIKISEINKKILNKNIKIFATIKSIQDKETFKILFVSDSSGEIQVLCNCKNNIKENQEVIILGKVTEYKETFQVQANKIINIEN